MKQRIFLFCCILFALTTNILAEGELTGKKLTEANCKACHEKKELNIASLKAMSLATENELVYVMTEGKMQSQAKHLSKSIP